jgi:hypothetical protein
MNAGDFHAPSPHDLAQREAHRAAHEPVDRQRPIVGINPRHSEVAEHDRILGARHAIEQLVWLKRMAAECAGWIKHCTGHGWKSLSHLRDHSADFSLNVSQSSGFRTAEQVGRAFGAG